ncbi:MAG: adenosylmethionine-8-amino-7-oxononanoate aminotransferase [Psychromonas sp.]
MYIMPPYIITSEQLQLLCHAIYNIVSEEACDL